MNKFTIGLEQLAKNPPAGFKGKKLGLLCNQASTDHALTHSRDVINQIFPGQLTSLFSPQHGFYSEKQDNMIESDHMQDPATGIPVYSLYAEKRRPDPQMFDNIDILLVDLIDVGTRVYTFIWTVVYCLQVAAETETRVVVLDRPNPIGGHMVEGNLLQHDMRSFVGMYEIPMRHGLTMGELALLCNRELKINAELEVIPVEGWFRNTFMDESLFPWVFPSPNMPSPATALVYPGQVIWEGTNISEGRGTTLPFLLCGAPYLQHKEVRAFLEKIPTPGCMLRPLVFEPTSGKWQGESCRGFQVHVTENESFLPYRTSLALLQAFLILYPDEFSYTDPPYEYEYEKLPIDMIIGSPALRHALEEGVDILDIERSWQEDIEGFKELSRSVFLYGSR